MPRAIAYRRSHGRVLQQVTLLQQAAVLPQAKVFQRKTALRQAIVLQQIAGANLQNMHTIATRPAKKDWE